MLHLFFQAMFRCYSLYSVKDYFLSTRKMEVGKLCNKTVEVDILFQLVTVYC